MQLGLDGFSKHISDVQDYRQAYVSPIVATRRFIINDVSD